MVPGRLPEWCPRVPNCLGLPKSQAAGWPGAGWAAVGWGGGAAVRQRCPCVSGKPQGVEWSRGAAKTMSLW